MKTLNTFKVDDRTRDLMRVHESFRLNESETLNSFQLSSWFGSGFKSDYIFSLAYVCPRVQETFGYEIMYNPKIGLLFAMADPGDPPPPLPYFSEIVHFL